MSIVVLFFLLFVMYATVAWLAVVAAVTTERTSRVLLKIALELKSEVRQIGSQVGEVKEQLTDIRASTILDAECDGDDVALTIPLNEFAAVESLEDDVN